jgi:hypothetical protein
VEIDPAIARIGRERHPENPYASEYVDLHIDHARSFLQRTDKQYDLVVFATLDSHTAFSSLSSLRMDNFIFTEKSVRSAKNRLNRFSLTGARQNRKSFFLGGELFDLDRPIGLTDHLPIEMPFPEENVETTSDDWPFLFLEKRGFPYVLTLFLILILAFIPLRMTKLPFRESVLRRRFLLPFSLRRVEQLWMDKETFLSGIIIGLWWIQVSFPPPAGIMTVRDLIPRGVVAWVFRPGTFIQALIEVFPFLLAGVRRWYLPAMVFLPGLPHRDLRHGGFHRRSPHPRLRPRHLLPAR